MDYSNHREQVAKVAGVIERQGEIEVTLIKAFEANLIYKEVPFINFGNITAAELAEVFINFPILVKPLITVVNVAGRAIVRDLGINIDTYKGRLTVSSASILAGYIMPMLPNELAIPAICELDRWFFVDKEIRKNKGNWEKTVLDAININSRVSFIKRKFTYEEKEYELDAATPITGTFSVGIDIKRIESKRDIHKRADEIINKAVKFKKVYPNTKFYAFIYFPFPTEHLSVQQRLDDSNIDGIYFANEAYSSIEQQAMFILGDAEILLDKSDVEEEL
ncbi:hypothetical protein [Paenibacillus sp. OK076]|uniref:hypothetical protein n=1 Tax=Paenibacillus sp. OK076 TaxID=1884379 RepID=UPI0008BBDA36|nr:hypothetical protein [Paenibacillus sp. OK076]SEM74764.1 hypothetical protein SAMN05518670_0111 [Paenibacillus sp. OK076]